MFTVSIKPLQQYLFLVVTICISAISAQNSACVNCLYGPDYCNPFIEVCSFGCKPGYREPKCQQRCNVNCVECQVLPNAIEECTRCQPGFYGPSCNIQCSDNCFGGNTNCDSFGYCFFGCKEPYSGAKCTESACFFENCIRCDVNYLGRSYCLECKTGYFWSAEQDQCVECSDNCLSGRMSCDTYSGRCTVCKQGWFGVRCENQCNINNCTTCGLSQNQKIICTQCEIGLYPLKDGSRCLSCDDRHCAMNVCNSRTGECIADCENGWFGEGKYCDRQCTLSNCAQCALSFDRTTVCVVCVSNTYGLGSYCVECPPGCLRSCHMQTGYCTECKQGFYGSKCDQLCSRYCVDDTCAIQSGYCNCTEGWFGPKCDRSCPIHCTNCASYVPDACESCEPGWFGPTCDIQCSSGCKYNDYSNYVTCDKVSGICTDGCISGYRGARCDIQCNPNCLYSTCDRYTDKCSYGCNTNYYGTFCNNSCPQNCAHITSGYQRLCEASRGTCAYGCQLGFYGNYCNQTCVRCKENTCNQSHGFCTMGCASGYTGKNCELLSSGVCPNDCNPNCNDCICDQVNRSCTTGCVTGWYGPTCDHICSGNCAGQVCQQATGNCHGNCSHGYWGLQCEKQCGENCLDGSCDRSTGACLKGCVRTFYDAYCTTKCLEACQNQTCLQKSGFCISCGYGRHGDKCEFECTPSTYGENCLKECGHCKDNNPCQPIGGLCPAGCELGWMGPQCDQAMYSVGQSSSSESSVKIGLAVGCVIGAVAVVVCIVLLRYWQKRQAHKKKREPAAIYHSSCVTFQLQPESQQNNNSDHSSVNSFSVLLGDTNNGIKIDTSQVVCETRMYTIYRGHMNSGSQAQHCCVKLVKLTDQGKDKESLNKLIHESEIQSSCATHINVVQLITTYYNIDYYCFALDIGMGSHLLQYLQSIPNVTDNGFVRQNDVCNLLQIAIDICSAVCYIHKLNVVHRQVQAQHVYLTDKLVAKLGDFYWAENLGTDPATCTSSSLDLPEECYRWLAPESLLHHRFMYPTDIWSFGLLLWEIFTFGMMPFQEVDMVEHQKLVLEGVRPSKPQHSSLVLYRIMKSCWRYDSTDRPSPELVLQQLMNIQDQLTDEHIVVDV